MMSDKDKYETSALAILQDEIEKLREQKDLALFKGRSRETRELTIKLEILEHIFNRFLNEIA